MGLTGCVRGEEVFQVVWGAAMDAVVIVDCGGYGELVEVLKTGCDMFLL